MCTDGRRPRITKTNRLASSRRRMLIVAVLVGCFTQTTLSLSQNSIKKSCGSHGSSHSNSVAPGSSSQTNPATNSIPIRRGYWCEHCSVGFNKRKSYLEHLAGKRHNAVVAEGDLVWEEYRARNRESVFYDDSARHIDVAKAWSLDAFAEGLRARGKSSKKKSVSALNMVGLAGEGLASPLVTGNNGKAGGGNQIDPSLRLGDLPPSKKAALFRYLHGTSSGIPCLPDMVESLPPLYVRIKELLESIEVYHQFREVIVKRSSKRGKTAPRLSRVYDIGCGHGLVGMLIAAAYPHIEVVSIDRVPRESFVAQKLAFETAGRPLTNLRFETGDLSILREMTNTEDHALVLCVHGCKELTHESIEVAREKNWAWLALPCCLQAQDHLDEGAALKVRSDHTRYALLCGVIAGAHNPEVITTIDSRITGRNILLASSGRSSSS